MLVTVPSRYPVPFRGIKKPTKGRPKCYHSPNLYWWLFPFQHKDIYRSSIKCILAKTNFSLSYKTVFLATAILGIFIINLNKLIIYRLVKFYLQQYLYRYEISNIWDIPIPYICIISFECLYMYQSFHSHLSNEHIYIFAESVILTKSVEKRVAYRRLELSNFYDKIVIYE